MIFLAAGVLNASVKEIFLEVNPGDFEYIYKNFLPDIYVPAKLTYQGKIYKNLELRIRGDDSRYLPKKSLKIKFNDGVFINGRSTLNFNAEYLDRTYIRQYLSSRILRMAGIPCFNVEHVRLYLNGKFLGLYLMVENVDDEYLSANGLDPKGNMYKATEDGACMSNEDIPWLHWEKKTNEDTDWLDLDTLIQASYATPDDKYLEFTKKNYDYNYMINTIAANIVIANGSTYYHNYFMYHHPDTKKWQYLPWDMDKTLQGYGWARPYHESSGIAVPDNPYMERALIDDIMFADVIKRVNELKSILNPDVLFPIIDSLVTVLEPSILEDTTDAIPDKNKWISEIGNDKIFIEKRIDYMNFQFENYPRSFKINKTRDTVTRNFNISWNKSKSPRNKEITYKVTLSSHLRMTDTARTVYYTGIKDTFMLVDVSKLKVNQQYWWKVEAYDGEYYTDGTDDVNYFWYLPATKLPCEINENMVLNKENSPYYVDCNVTVGPNAKLTINKGVVVRFHDSTQIMIKGGLEVNGTENEPVRFQAENPKNAFAGIFADYPKKEVKIDWAEFKEGTLRSIQCKDFKVSNTNIWVLNNIGEKKIVQVVGGTFDFRNNMIKSSGQGEGMIIYDVDNPIVENCKFYNAPDMVEYMKCRNGIIRNNMFDSPKDDAIDFNSTSNTLVENNFFINTSDKGVSIGNDGYGPSDNNTIRHNVFVNCLFGVQIKDSSTAILYNNTFYSCNTGIALNVKWLAGGGGTCIAYNNLFNKSKTKNVTVDEFSKLDQSYSLADNELLTGENNIKASPEFVDESNYNFYLKSNSNCIDKGKPGAELDPDGTRKDIGAFYFDKSTPNIVINEINYNSSYDYDTDDWVELYNPNPESKNLSCWILKDANDDNSFVFPANTWIEPNSYLLITRDFGMLRDRNRAMTRYIGNMKFGFDAGGDEVRLFNADGKLIDYVKYDDKSPWPTESDGDGATLELIHPSLDNTLPSSWRASSDHGSPFAKNTVWKYIRPVESNKSIVSNMLAVPNPCVDRTNFIFSLDTSSFIDFKIISTNGIVLKEFKEMAYSKGQNSVEFNFKSYPSGKYFLIIEAEGCQYYYPLVIAR